MRVLQVVLLCGFHALVQTIGLHAQIHQFPYTENFDSVVAPTLPSGWTTTTNRLASGHFTTTTSAVYSDPNAVLSTNAADSQSLTSPPLDFSNKEADGLMFYERRSGTHNSGVIVEASIDGGITFSIQIGDTLKNLGATSYTLRALPLPQALSNQAMVNIRWRVVGNGTGSSGTLRFDDITISAKTQFDAAVTRITFLPQFPNVGDSLQIFAAVKNVGTQPVQDIPVEFYQDSNGDSLPDQNELIASTTLSQILQPNDTVSVTATAHNLLAGQQTFMVRTLLSSDQNPSNDLLRAVVSVGLAKQSVVVNEIMYAPTSGPEWIELYNTTSNALDIKGWKLSRGSTGSKYTITNSQTLIPQQGYVVVTKDSSYFLDNYPFNQGTIIQASSLPEFFLNNSGSSVVLFDQSGAQMDSIRYLPTWGGNDSTSLERIEPLGSSTDATNWGSSGDTNKSTPGKQNYLTPLDYNLHALRVLSVTAVNFYSLVIQNIGRLPASNFSVSLYYDANEDSLAQDEELIQTLTQSTTLQPKDSLVINFTWDAPTAGELHLIGKIDDPQDLRTSDNIVVGSVKISFSFNALVVNEIMYEPATGQAEYIELYNRSATPVNIRNWRIADEVDTSTTSKTHVIRNSSLVIRAGEYVVVTSDSSIYTSYPYLTDSAYHVIIKHNLVSLNNDGDNIILSDLTRTTIDSIHYLPSWHNADVEQVSGKSLERINPHLPSNDKRNWSTCANPRGGTPGKQNSLYTITVPSSASLSFSPNPFSPDGDGFEDVTIMSYELPSTTGLIRARIYDASGRLVRTLADGEPSGSHGELIWNGYNDRNERIRMGIYVVLLEALDGNGGEVQTVKGVVVVAAKM